MKTLIIIFSLLVFVSCENKTVIIEQVNEPVKLIADTVSGVIIETGINTDTLCLD